MQRVREQLAAVAARLIVEGQLKQWQQARRKAAETLGLPLRGTPMPSDEEIVAALVTHQRLFGGDEHREQLRAQRETALEVMLALAHLSPRLTGAVAEGWAHAGSEIRIEVDCESEKMLDYALIDLGVEYRVEPGPGESIHYVTDDADWPLRLVAGQRARMSAATPHATRLDVPALRKLLSEDSRLA